MLLPARVLSFLVIFVPFLWADTQPLATITLPDATAGIDYAVRLSFKGFVVATPYRVNLTAPVDSGATFEEATGLLKGKFTSAQAGKDLDLVITITDANQNTFMIAAKLPVKAAQPVSLTREGVKLPSATVDHAYDVQLETGGKGSITASNLPAGLKVEESRITGVPTSANPAEGDYTVVIKGSEGGKETVWPATLHLYLNPQVVTVSPPSCLPASPPEVIGVLKDQATTIAGQAVVPKGCTAKIRIWNVDNWRPQRPTARLDKSMLNTVQGRLQLAIKSGGDIASTGAFTVTLSDALIAGQTLYIEECMLDSSGREVNSSFSDPAYVEGFGDWGRIRAYFTAGILISQDQGSFSQSSLFLSFLLDKSWRLPGYYYGKKVKVSNPKTSYGKKKRESNVETSQENPQQKREDEPQFEEKPQLKWPPGFNTYFEARLTSVPVTACPAGSQAQTASNQCTTSQSFNTFLTSQKTAVLQVGGYFPFTLTAWSYKRNANALFLAPLAKVGFSTPTSPINQNQAQGQSTGAGNTPAPGTTITPVNSNNFYNFYGYGIRSGHYALTNSKDHAPELISYIDVIIGRFSNLETFLQGPGGGPPQRARLYRIALEGILKIPATPLSVGFGANIGQEAVGVGNNTITRRAGDDLRFLFGIKFDVGKLMERLKTTFQ